MPYTPPKTITCINCQRELEVRPKRDAPFHEAVCECFYYDIHPDVTNTLEYVANPYMSETDYRTYNDWRTALLH